MAEIVKNMEKIANAFSRLNKHTKKAIRIGLIACLALFAAGTLTIAINHTFLNLDSYIEFIGQSVVRSAFVVLAEIMIGSLFIDHIFNN